MITKVNEFSTEEQTFKLNMYVRHEWKDSRLEWNPVDYCGIEQRYDLQRSEVWVPDTFFANANSVKSVADEEFLQISSAGSVFWSHRSVLTFFCPMTFLEYPFDEQTCESVMESYGLPTDVLRYELAGDESRWGPHHTNCTGTPRNCAFTLLSSDVSSVGSYVMSAPVAGTNHSVVGGVSYSRAYVRFSFQRLHGRYFVTLFMPLALISSLSFLALYVDPGMTPARVGMAITTVLVLINLMFVLTKELPSNSTSMSSMDGLIGICLTFVAANGVEYAVVNYLNTAIATNEGDIAKRQQLRGRSDADDSLSPRTLAALRAELRDIFLLFDQGRGAIDMASFAAILKSLAADRGVSITPQRLDEIAREADADGNGSLDWKEFQDFVERSAGLRCELGLNEPVAVALCGWGISRRTVRAFESGYRRLVAPLFAGVWGVWFAVSSVDTGSAGGVATVGAAALATLVAVGVTERFAHRLAPQPARPPRRDPGGARGAYQPPHLNAVSPPDSQWPAAASPLSGSSVLSVQSQPAPGGGTARGGRQHI